MMLKELNNGCEIQQNLNFALIGAAGFVAPRHMKAIKETCNQLIIAHDINDSVGIIDSYFPNALFYKEFNFFKSKIQNFVQEQNNPIDFLSVCTPNHQHKFHTEFGLQHEMNVICEKPLVLTVQEVDELIDLSRKSAKKIFTILQLRLHPNIVALKKRVENSDKMFDVDLTYLTPRGNWYLNSWKGEECKSGGIATNVGIHLFDMLCWVFGDVKNSVVHQKSNDSCAGFLEFDKARVRWFLSINREFLPAQNKTKNSAFRSLTINGDEISFSNGFEDLHTKSYKKILNGLGFGVEESKAAIAISQQIRTSLPIGLRGDYHPFAKSSV